MKLSEEVRTVRLEELWPVMSEQIEAGGTVCFGPKGVSMMPMIRQGIDTVVIAKAPDRLKKYDIPLYRRPDGQFVLHRVISAGKNGVYTMRGDNQTVSEKNVPHEWVLGILIGFNRGAEYIGADNAEYIKYYKKQVRKQSMRAAVGKIKRGLKKIIK